MKSERKLVKLAGLLFLVQMFTAILSYSVILEPILLGSKNFLPNVASHSIPVKIAALLDFTTTLTYFAIAVLLFPILARHSKRIAIWFAGIRLSEFVTLTLSGIFLLTLVSISQSYVEAGISEASVLQMLGKQILQARIHTQNLNLLAYCFGTIMFFYLLFTSRLVPRFISIWGMIGVAGIFTEIIMSIFGYSNTSLIYYLGMPMGLNELFLGVWLVVKGLNTNQQGVSSP